MRLSAFLLALTSAAACALFPGLAPAAMAFDGVVDTAHVSHVAWQDRRPLCPVDQQPFEVRLYALRGDVASVRVAVRPGGDGTWVNATRRGTRGAYDVWSAQLPAASASELRYWFELADGAARAYVSASGVSPAPPADSGWVVDFATLSHAPLGATPLPEGGVVFRVWAPNATAASVRGEFNAWGVTPMQRLGEDFVARVPTAVVDERYKYFFSSGTWSPDARGRALDPAGGYWNSQIADPGAFAWTDSAWRTPPVDRMVIYQLNVGTFAGLNDPNGATPFPSRFIDLAARANELRALGVNAVMLNPVTSTPSLQFAGYSTLNPWSPEWSYGSPDDFKAAVDALHADGIAVLCDIVWNHVDGGTTFLWNYDGGQPYFETPSSVTPWGYQAAFGRPGVDDYFAHSALHWLEEYHVDGFRMDAVAFMSQPPHEAAGWALMQRFNGDLERRYRGAVTIAENFPLQGQVVLPASVGGAGFTAEYNGTYRSNLRSAVPHLTGASYFGSLLANTTVAPGLTAGHQSFNYVELHDDAWDIGGSRRWLLDVAPTPGVIADTAAARMRVTLGALLLTPGVPALLMGDEWLETAAWGTAPQNRIDWSKRTSHAAHFAYVRDLIDLRIHTPALAADAPSVPTHANASDGVFAWMRHDATGRLFLIVVNLGDSDFPSYLLGAPAAGEWFERLNSQAAGYGGTGWINEGALTAFTRAQDGYPRTLDVRLPRSSVVVLQARNTLAVEPTTTGGAIGIECAWPNPASGPLRIAFTLPRSGETDLAVFDTQGRRVATVRRGMLEAGPHELAWDGRGADGENVAAGLYLLRLRTAEGASTRRITVVR